MSYSIEQSSHWDGSDGQDWWRWSVWIGGDDADLDDVAWVEYKLHPTFPKPIIRVTDRESAFRLEASGWGEFMIRARLRLKASESDLELSHWLELTKPSGGSAVTRGMTSSGELAPPQAPGPAPQAKVVLSVGPGQEKLADLVAQALRDDGVQVSTMSDIQPGSIPLEIQMEKVIGDADALVAFLGSSGSKWVERDVGVAQSHSVPVLPVLVGKSTETPSSMSGLQIVQIGGRGTGKKGIRKLSGEVRVLLDKAARPLSGGFEHPAASRPPSRGPK